MNQNKDNNCIVSKDFNGVRLDYWLKKKIKSSNYPFICKIIRKGYVRVNKKRVDNSFLLKSGDLIVLSKKILIEEEKTSKKPDKKFEQIIKSWVIYKDENLIVLNKPSGIAVQGGTKIKVNVDILLDHLKFKNLDRPKLVHRLDKNTSGILLIARNLNYAKFLGDKFKNRKIEKKYLAFVHGVPNYKTGRIEIPLFEGERKLSTVTLYKVLKSSTKDSLVLIKPITGRKHQIRKHFSLIGNFIIGENKDFIKKKPDSLNKNFFLHALELSYKNIDSENFLFTAPLPEYFIEKIKDLGFEFDEISSKKDFLDLHNYQSIEKIHD